MQKAQLATGRITASHLTRTYLDRIQEKNKQIHALSEVLEVSALDTARAIDRGDISGPLAGLCLVVKDMIDVAGAACSGGLDYLKGRTPGNDSAIVAVLRKAGANILGMATSDTGGFGIRTPLVQHPLAVDRIVGGSSGGSAAAVVADFAPVALGTDSGGSIRIPAACCQLTGYKPTWGHIVTEGIIPFAPTTDHVGLLANCIHDITLVTAVVDPANRTHSPSKPSIKSVKIGLDNHFFHEAEDAVKQTMIEMESLVRSLGWEIVPVKLPHPDEIAPIHDAIVAKEATEIHGSHFERTADLQKPVVRSTIEFGSSVTSKQYERACHARVELAQEISKLFEQADVLMLPTMPCLPPKKTDTLLKLGNRSYPIDEYLRRYTSLFNLSRHPVVSIPVKSIFPGIGVSLQFAGPHDSDEQLLEIVGSVAKTL
jgi:Asp-tRNA(Asn)/Glu-tRNA(Gln) amidotransferase A subunit family amidase